ncbi:MAG TPA: polymer-forming cytoskeletal protein, partial [Nitrospiraceae bacterium]|nr:polymer-forming cytoskeletal protein [Nitrospiraceae bacterium]
GVIHFDGTVRIDGRLDGEVHTKGTLVIGEHAVIKGLITAGTVICGGKIKATITATEKVQLLKPAVILGDVRTPAIVIEEGAHIHGMCDMGVNKWSEQNDEPAKALENVHDLAAHRGKVRAQDGQS